MGYRKIDGDFITIIIVTYNRGYIINRALRSIARQTVRGFQILVVDDGSTDDTKAVISEFEAKSGLYVKYIYKENGGVHTARNAGIRNCRTQFFYMLDSDDEIMPDTIEYLYDTWNLFSGRDKERYQLGIAGLTKDMSTGNICGGGYGRSINRKSRKSAYKVYARGERVVMRNTSICKKFPYVEIKGLKYVPEGTRDEEIFSKYRYFYVNKVFRKYHMDTMDSYTKGNVELDVNQSMYAMYLYKVNHYYPSYLTPFLKQAISYAYIARFGYALGLGYQEMKKEIASSCNKMIFTLLYPLGIVAYRIRSSRII